jgi:hypothetical protein
MTVRAYYHHRVYCDAEFDVLVSLLADYLYAHTYVVDSMSWDHDYETFASPHIRINADRTRATVLASPARSIAEDSGMILFAVENMREACDGGYLSYECLPLAIRQRFEICPNYISIETHRKWYLAQKEIGQKLASWIANQGRETYIRSFEGEFIEIVETAYTEEAEVAEEIHRLVGEFFQRHQLPDLVSLSSFPDYFIWLLPQMHPDTVAALASAELIRSTIPSLPDCSAVVIEYCKAVEIELNEKILRPLRAHWSRRSISDDYRSPGELRRLHDYLFGASPRPLELGTLAVTLDATGHPRHDGNPVAVSLRTHLQELPFHDEIIPALPRDLLRLSRDFRNPAAHKARLSPEQLEDCRDFVVGTDSQPGLLTRILKAV